MCLTGLCPDFPPGGRSSLLQVYVQKGVRFRRHSYGSSKGSPASPASRYVCLNSSTEGVLRPPILIIRRTPEDMDYGNKSSKYNWDYMICHSCRQTISDSTALGEFKRSSQHLRKEEELRWRQASADGRIELCVRRWVHPVVPRWGAGSIGRGFGKKLLEGLSSEESAVAAGVSPAVGARWFRQCGGMPPFSLRPLSGRYLSFVEREEIAVLQARGCGVREIARQLRRSSSTISRELRRNAATRSGNLEYRATTAQWHADRRAKRPKVAKLAANGELRQYVQDRLGGLIAAPDGAAVPGPNVRWVGRRRGRRQDRRWAASWSPEQIANRLRVDFPDDESMRISHEAIYQALYVQGRGALRRELTACLRDGTRATGASSSRPADGVRRSFAPRS